MSTCTGCGKENDFPFCPYCGTKNMDYSSVEAESGDETELDGAPLASPPTNTIVETKQPTDSEASSNPLQPTAPAEQPTIPEASVVAEPGSSTQPICQPTPDPSMIAEDGVPAFAAPAMPTPESPSQTESTFAKVSSSVENLASKLGVSKKVVAGVGGGVAAAIALIALLFGTHVICFHDWTEATCLHPKTCTFCGRIEGKALGHSWTEATCTEPKTCTRCGYTTGEPAEHSWQDATCSKPKTCSVCGATEGKPLKHEVAEWHVDKEPTCSATGVQSGTCSLCGESVTQDIEKTEHTPGDWEVVKEPEISPSGDVVNGEESRICTVCGEVVETREVSIEITVSQKNALRTADRYLNAMSFSYDGLISQLEYEGYSAEDAAFAADYCGADWYKQAELKAAEYLDFMGFSRSGLIDQLIYEGFTADQAEHGADAVGL